MHYRLRDGLSLCRVDGHTIFMDLPADRYFELPPVLAHSLDALLQGTPLAAAQADPLVSRNLVIPTEAPQGALSLPELPCGRSAMERPATRPRHAMRHAIEVFCLVRSTRRWLKTRPLGAIVDRLVQQRSPATRTIDDDPLLEASAAFLQARLYVPVETSCLLDSISLCRFLTRRGLSWSLVFGVTRYPFAAHCWVQAGDLVLNDTVGNVAAHTQIRVV